MRMADYTLDGSPFQDFVFFSMGSDDHARTTYESARWLHFPGDISGVKSFVEYVVAICTANLLVARHIRIVSHGTPDHFWIGHDRMSVRTLGSHRSALRRLDLYLVP